MVLVTASRTWQDRAFIWARLDEVLAEHGLMVLVHGDCPEGGDFHADAWAKTRIREGRNILINRFPANWGKYGRAAGMKRNAEMVDALGAAPPAKRRVLAFIRDDSKGASRCVKLARRAGIEPTVYRWDERKAEATDA